MLANRSLMTYYYYIERGNTSITNAAQRQELKMKTRNNKSFDIPSFSDSLKMAFEAGTIELKEAAIEFHKANWTAFVDIEYTKKQLGIK